MNEEKEDSPQLKKIKEQITQLSYEDKLLLYEKLWKSIDQEYIAKQVMEQDKEALSKLSDH